MIVEISNKKENYLNHLGLLKGSRLARKNSVRLVNINDKFRFNINGVDDLTVSERVLKSLSKHTLNANRITAGKNRQEEKRFELKSRLLDKNYSNEDYNWLHEFFATKAKLKEIETSSSRKSSSTYSTRTRLNSYGPSRFRASQSDMVDKIRSYTSLVGPENDLNKDEITEKLVRVRSKSKCWKDENDECNEEVGNYDRFKSIRRPLLSTGSARDVQARIRGLQTRVDFCRAQSENAFRKHDRHVRYGEPLPKVKIYRQLRIMTKMEEFIR